MRLIMLPLLFSLAYIGYEHRDKIVDQYNAAYPADPAKSAAIEHCVAENPRFNRLDADDRQQCYHGAWGAVPVATAVAPNPSPYYAYSPSHLAGNDIRRQEANDGYRLAVIQSPPAPPPRPVVVTVRVPVPPPYQATHYRVRYRTTADVSHQVIPAWER